MSSLRWLPVSCIVLLGCVLSPASNAADETVLKRLSLPGRGVLELQAPSNWRERVRQRTDGGPPTIVFSPAEGAPFEVSFTPSLQKASSDPAAAERALRERVQRAVNDIRGNVRETEIAIRKFDGTSGPGFFFSASDKAPKPDDFKFVTQGVLKIGQLTVTFTMLTFDAQEDVVGDALTMLKTATYWPPPR